MGFSLLRDSHLLRMLSEVWSEQMQAQTFPLQEPWAACSSTRGIKNLRVTSWPPN